MATSQELEIELIKRFVVKSKVDRLIGFACKPEQRRKLINELNSPGIFEPRYLKTIESNKRSPSTLSELYKELGMGGRVYVISENDEWDSQKFQTTYIVDQCVRYCSDTIGYCWKTQTAFFEWHHNESYFLAR